MDIAELVSKATDAAAVGRAFGPSRESGGTMIVPVAWIVSAGGGGGGKGVPPGKGVELSDEQSSFGPGEGGGGGFVNLAFPLGAYVVKDGNVRWVPAVDATRLAIAAIAIVRHLVKRRSHRKRSAR